MLWEHLGIWLAAALTLGIVSFLYKDNIYYKMCEAIFVGSSAGYWFVTYFWDNLYKKFYTNAIINGDFAPWIGFVLGVLMLSRLFNKIGWLSRWPLAFIIGATAGVYMMFYFVSNAMMQISASINVAPFLGKGIGGYFSLICIAGGTFCGLVYFFFSKEHKGAFGGAARIGIWFLMITFGASFGYTVMSRMSLMLGRLDFLFGQWLGLIS